MEDGIDVLFIPDEGADIALLQGALFPVVADYLAGEFFPERSIRRMIDIAGEGCALVHHGEEGFAGKRFS